MIYAVDYHAAPLCLDAKNDPMRKVDEMADFHSELFVLRNQGTSFRQFFEGMDRLNETAKPPYRRFGLLPDIADETNIFLGIDQCRFCDINLECQASPEVLPVPSVPA